LGASAASSVSAPAMASKQSAWVILLLLVVALSTLEWATYHRRVTI
jgi:hypothetical protein